MKEPFFRDQWNQFLFFLVGFTSIFIFVKIERYVASRPNTSIAPTVQNSNLLQKIQNSNGVPASSTTLSSANGNNANIQNGGQIQGQGFAPVIKSKKKGTWVVDQYKAPDSDTDCIAVAITNAEEGDVIEIMPGTYGEDLKLNKYLVLKGAGRDLVIIRAVSFSEVFNTKMSISDMTFEGGLRLTKVTGSMNNIKLNSTWPLMIFDSDAVQVRGAEIAYAKEAVRIKDSQNVLLSNFIIHHIDTFGITTSRSKVVIEKLSIEYCDYPLQIRNGSEIRLSDFYFDKNEISLSVTNSALIASSGKIYSEGMLLSVENADVELTDVMGKGKSGVYNASSRYTSSSTRIHGKGSRLEGLHKSWYSDDRFPATINPELPEEKFQKEF